MSLAGPDACHCHAMRRGARLLTRIYDRHLAPVGLNLSQFALLSVIDKQPGIAALPLAAQMVMERTTLLRALKPLRGAGLVSAATDGGKDLRYRLTDAGMDRLRAAAPLWQAAQAEFEGQFTANRAAALRGEVLALTALA